METEKRQKRLCVTLLCLCLAFIWGNSLLPGEISGAISDFVKELLYKILFFLPSTGASSSGGLLRKLAHFTEFACLGALLAWLHALLGRRPFWGLGWGFLAACVDETIQRFVPDRGPSFFDVLIDTSGVTLGILLLLAGFAIHQKTKSNGGNET